MIRPKQIVAAATRVTLFWSAVAGILYFHDFDYRLTLANFVVIAASLIFGALISTMLIYQDRRSIEHSIQAQVIRGMQSSIGAIPVHSPTLRADSGFPSADVQPPEIADLLSLCRPKMGDAMGLLFDEVMKTLWAYKETPAAPLLKKNSGVWVLNGSHNHGGRSLVTHSLLVANLMCEQAKYYYYKAPRHHGVALFNVLDPAFQLDPDDPLIPIIGLAHDIGKIECIVWEDGKPSRMEDGHDFLSARIVARMDPFWHPDIDAESRRILQTVLAHHHHVQDVPMQKNGEPTSDRLHALMELLVKCDRAASAIENCSDAEEKDAVKNRSLQEAYDAGQMHAEVKSDADELLSIIHLILLGPGRINNRTKGDSASIGWKYFLPQYQKTVVVLKEDVFIQAVANHMGIDMLPEVRTGEASPALRLTQEVLKTLNTANLLFTDFDEHDRCAMSQLYRADFYKPSEYFTDNERTHPKKDLSGLSKVFSMDGLLCIQVDEYEPLYPLRTTPDYPCVFHIGNARLGRQGMRAQEKRLHEAEEAARQPANALERIANIQSRQAGKEHKAMAPVHFKALVERELGKDAENWRFKSRSDVETTIIYDCDEWLKSEVGMTFELVQAQNEHWKKMAGIVRLHISDKGTKIIYLNKVAAL